MAAYATERDVRVTVARNPERVRGTAAEMDDNEILAQLENAEAQVNGTLRGRYTIPFAAPAPLLVKSIVIDIAAYLATLTYRQGRDLEPTDPINLRYVRAMKLLGDIACGSVDLDVGDGGEAGGSRGTIRPPHNPSPKMFGLADFGLGLHPSRRLRGDRWG